MLGTIHLDIKSAPLLRSALFDLKPDIVTVEISKFSVSFRQEQSPIWRRCLKKAVRRLPLKERAHPQIRLLKRQISMPYEWSVAKEYSEAAGIPCIAIDSGFLARTELPDWQNTLLTPQNIKFLVKGPKFCLDSYFLEYHRAVRNLWERPHPSQLQATLAFLEKPCWSKREHILAIRLKRLLRLGYKLVHIGGWMHILDSKEFATLSYRLMDFICGKRLILRT